MALPRRYVYNSALPNFVLGGQDVLNMDWVVTPFQASILVDVIQGGSATFSVEYTIDDINHGNPLTWRWLPTAGFPYGTTSVVPQPGPPIPLQWTLNFPVIALRLNLQALTGAVVFSVIQGHDI
jgi:hypothetical protein